MDTTLITRADDFGSSNAANKAIFEAITQGQFIKNVSCMAPGPLMDAGAEVLHNQKHVCLGLHFTVNAEWDLIKWPPICDKELVSSLVDEQGAFLANPALFAIGMPAMNEVMLELNAQLDFLARLKLDICYVDSHMFPERVIPGLSQEMEQWANRKGLLFHQDYYRFPKSTQHSAVQEMGNAHKVLLDGLSQMEEGQYTLIMHPAIGFREMLLCGNSDYPAKLVQAHRAAEHALLLSGMPEQACQDLQIECIRYDQANKVSFREGAWRI